MMEYEIININTNETDFLMGSTLNPQQLMEEKGLNPAEWQVLWREYVD